MVVPQCSVEGPTEVSLRKKKVAGRAGKLPKIGKDVQYKTRYLESQEFPKGYSISG